MKSKIERTHITATEALERRKVFGKKIHDVIWQHDSPPEVDAIVEKCNRGEELNIEEVKLLARDVVTQMTKAYVRIKAIESLPLLK